MDLVEAYDKSADAFDKKIASLPNYVPTYEVLLQLLPDNAAVLDLACGPGNISRFLLAHRKDGTSISVTGIDVSPAMLALASSYIPDGTFICSSIVDFSLPGKNAFDAVINGFGIPYLTDDETERCLRHAVSFVKKGGLFYVSFMQGTTSRLESPSFNPDVQFTVYYHDQQHVEKILADCGLTVVRSWTLDYQEQDGSVTVDVVILARKI